MSRHRLTVAVVMALAWASGSAHAQSGRGQVFRSYVDGHPLYGIGVPATPTPFSSGGSCVKWCLADITPCDPDYFKVADRRCNVNQNGVFP